VTTAAPRAVDVEVPWTSPRLSAVTAAVWAATRAAGTSDERTAGAPPAAAPSSTSSPRVLAMTAVLPGPDFAERS
jgi:hypothetical protein